MSIIWIVVAVALVLGYLAYRLFVKPMLKILAILILALIVWLLLTNYL